VPLSCLAAPLSIRFRSDHLRYRTLHLFRRALPLLVAYFFYDYCNQAAIYTAFSRAHGTIMKILHRDAYDNNLEMLLEPPRPSIFGSWMVEGRWFSVAEYALYGGVFLGVLAFEVYAFYRNLQSFGVDDVVSWIAIVITTFLTAYGIAILWRRFD